ncbi:MAG: acyl-CoA dehydrogenase family protein, partial [Chloroflexota bacterium]
FVPDAHVADYVICAARTSDARADSEGISLFLLRMSDGQVPGVSIAPLRTMAGDKQYELVLDNARVAAADVLGEIDGGWKPLDKVLQVAALGKCAEAVGAIKKTLEMDVEHGKTRIQFGVPIGSFQAVQHHCANIATDKDIAEFLTHYAAWKLDRGDECAREVSMAKAFVGDAYIRTVVRGHQVLGGVGLTEEHEMPLYSKRAPAVQQLFGSTDYHRELIAQRLGL